MDPKTIEYEYEIQGCYSGEWEAVTCEKTRAEANETARTYRRNETNIEFKVVKVRVIVKDGD